MIVTKLYHQLCNQNTTTLNDNVNVTIIFKHNFYEYSKRVLYTNGPISIT